jgi:hypothetical protein
MQCQRKTLHTGAFLYPEPMSDSTEKIPEQEKFTKALASLLKADPKRIREAEAKAETKPSSLHKRYKFVPVEDQP